MTELDPDRPWDRAEWVRLGKSVAAWVGLVGLVLIVGYCAWMG
jgi:hypothetical protein